MKAGIERPDMNSAKNSGLLVLGVVLSCGCATSDHPVATPPVEAEVGEAAPRRESSIREPVHAVRYNRTLIYPVRWGRADELAATLQPLFESTYGPGVRVIPHLATNQLLIYLPPLAEREPAPRPTPSPRTPR